MTVMWLREKMDISLTLSLRKAGTNYCFSISCSGFFSALAAVRSGWAEVVERLAQGAGWCD